MTANAMTANADSDMFDIAALGELLIDFTPNGTNTEGTPQFLQNPGGAPANVLAAASAWGCRTAFIGKVGDDAFGSFLRDTLIENNIDARGLVFSKTENTTLAFVHIDGTGDRSFSFYRDPGADMMLRETEIDMPLLAKCKIFHFGSVSMTHTVCREATLAAARAAKKSGAVVSFDPNYRPPLWHDSRSARDVILEALPLANILKVSEDEAEFLSGGAIYQNAARKLADMGPQVVLVSLGGSGSYFFINTPEPAEGHVTAFSVKPVDTTGAGDAFIGTVLAQLCSYKTRPETLSAAQWKEILLNANAAGALTTTGKGAIKSIPARAETEKLAKSQVPAIPELSGI